MMFLCWLFRGNDFDRNKVMTYRPDTLIDLEWVRADYHD